MFNLGLPEIVILGVIALLVFGPRRLPELAKNVGKGIRDFKRALEGGEDVEGPKDSPKPDEQTAPQEEEKK